MNAMVKIGDVELEPARLDRAGILAAKDSGLLDALGRVEVIDGVMVRMSPSLMSRTAAFFRRDVVEQLVNQHESSGQNHGYRLWNLLILENWLRRWG